MGVIKRGRPLSEGGARTKAVALRCAAELHERIKSAAAANGHSITSEVVRRLERTFLEDDFGAVVRKELECYWRSNAR